jgi:molybdate transport system regulatory protein
VKPSHESPADAAPQLRLRMRVTRGDAIAVGPGKIELLEALQRTHSINGAAKALGMSYRRAWLLVDELNAALREPAVRSATGGAHGGGSELTATGAELIRLYRAIEQRARQACAAEIDELLALLKA